MDTCIDSQMNGWMDESMNGQIERWVSLCG